MYNLDVAKSIGIYQPEQISECADAGITKIELSLARLPVTFDRDELGALLLQRSRECQNKGVEILSIHLPFGADWEIGCCDDVIREYAIQRYLELLSCCQSITPKRYILHPGYPNVPDNERKERIQNIRDSLVVLAHAAKPAKIAVENMPRDCLGNTSDELIEIVEGLENVCVCCDMNHWLQEKNYEAIEKLGALIETLHVSDYDGVEEKHWLPGEGSTDWKRVLQALEKISYNGPFLYECSGSCKKIAENKQKLFE